jgi:transposase
VARPTKLTETVAADIALAVADGATFKAAAGRAGVGERTYREWMARGRSERERLEAAQRELALLPKRARSAAAKKAKQAMQRAAQPRATELPFLDLLERAERADDTAQVRAVAQITAAGATDWRAAAWLLERRDPANYSARSRVAVEGAGAPVKLAVGSDDRGVSDAAREFLRSHTASTPSA